MRLNEGTRSAVALALLAATIGVVLMLAAPAASHGRSPTGSSAGGAVPRVPIEVAAAAAGALTSAAPGAEAAVMRRAAATVRHRAWLADRVKTRSRAAERSHGGNGGSAGGMTLAAASGDSVRGMVISLFSRIAGPGQVGMALCIANRESHFNPYARNPGSSAAGVFQWVSGSWATYSRRYGYGGASVFDAYANIAVAAHAVADGGWGPWGGGCW